MMEVSLIFNRVKKVVLVFLLILFIFGCEIFDNNINQSDLKRFALLIAPATNNIFLMDLNINRIIQRFEADGIPTSLAISPNQKLILVTNSDSGKVSVFFRKGNTVFQKLESVGEGNSPYGVAFNPVYPEAYVAYQGDGKI